VTGATRRADHAYPSGAPDDASDFCGVHVQFCLFVLSWLLFILSLLVYSLYRHVLDL